MRSWRSLFALFAAALGLAATLSLGHWQLRRAHEKATLQARWDQALLGEPVRLAVDEPSLRDLPARVRLRGSWRHDKTVWLANRMHENQVGFFVITPVQLGAQQAVLVNRGFVARDPVDPQRLPAIAQPEGSVEVEGLAIARPARALQLGQPETRLPGIWQNLDYARYEHASGLRVPHFVVQQNDARADGLQRNWPRPDAGVDKHRGYAVQWFSLAALIVLLTLWFGVLPLWRSGTKRTSARGNKQ